MNVLFNASQTSADFLCDYWGMDHCDPDSWTYAVSTFGIDGVSLGEKKMVLWEDTQKSDLNIGRKFGTDLGSAERIAEDIRQNGIDTKCPVVYIDGDNGDRVGGGHRYRASQILGIPGWMCQLVYFKSNWAKERFARKINNERSFIQNNNSPEDVEELIRLGIISEEIQTEQQIRDEIRFQSSNSFGKQRQESLANSLILELHLKGTNTIKLERYVTYNDDSYKSLVERSDDSYVEEIISNSAEYCHYLNHMNWGSRTNPLITVAAEASRKDKPLHLINSVAKPSVKESLKTKRDKVFDVTLKNLEVDLDSLYAYKFRNGCYPWRNKNCQHTFLAQDTHNEDLNSFIRKS